MEFRKSSGREVPRNEVILIDEEFHEFGGAGGGKFPLGGGGGL
jgi:hypothetical protein